MCDVIKTIHLSSESGTMHSCNQCDKILSTAFNLRRHLELCHDITPSKEKTQTGGGLSDTVSNSSEDDVSDVASENLLSDDGENSDEDNENWVFDRFLHKIDMTQSLAQCQQLFRQMYSDFLIWYNDLRQNEIHKKIMETVRNLKDLEYDREECLQAAVDQRKFLLDRVVESFREKQDQDPNDDDDDDDEDEDV